jgi:hypothetical protein
MDPKSKKVPIKDLKTEDGADGLNATFNAHETGHCYGLAHSWSANPDVEYGDPWDIMSAMRVRAFDNKDYPPAGPGLNAPTLGHQRPASAWT